MGSAGAEAAVTAVAATALAVWLAQEFTRRHRPQLLLWSAALALFGTAAGCEASGIAFGWSATLYRLWYLTGAVLTAAFLGAGTLYLHVRPAVAKTATVLLLAASVVAAIRVLGAPVDFAATANGVPSGTGMPTPIRQLTPWFNVLGTAALLGSAAFSLGGFAWHGGSGRRALGVAAVAAGSIVAALGGILSRLGVTSAIFPTELAGVLVIGAGVALTSVRNSAPPPSLSELHLRRRRVVRISVGSSAGALLGAVAVLPILPWPMGIVTDARSSVTAQLPAQNRGTYLITRGGAMQLYAWYTELDAVPLDAPTLSRSTVLAVAAVQKQFDDPAHYRLYQLPAGNVIPWRSVARSDHTLRLIPPTPLPRGDYLLTVPSDGMFGGHTSHYFRLR